MLGSGSYPGQERGPFVGEPSGMRKLLTLLLAALLTSLALAQAPAVQELSLEWRDASRDRTIPVKFYYPATSAKPLPVIVWSHGLGGSREGYEYLGRHWASKGYVSVHLQHAGSDREVLRSGRPMQAMKKAAADPEAARNRPLDVKFAVDRLPEVTALEGRLDLQRLGVGGHSFGAWTTMAVAGQKFPVRTDWADPRFRAALAMSAPVPRQRAEEELQEAYGSIRIPLFLMTGTRDETPFDPPGAGAPQRRLPYDGMKGPDKLLLIFEGGDHMVFSGRVAAKGFEFLNRGPRDDAADERRRKLILDASTAFWNAYLKDDAQARRWLLGGGFAGVLGAGGTFEVK